MATMSRLVLRFNQNDEGNDALYARVIGYQFPVNRENLRWLILCSLGH